MFPYSRQRESTSVDYTVYTVVSSLNVVLIVHHLHLPIDSVFTVISLLYVILITHQLYPQQTNGFMVVSLLSVILNANHLHPKQDNEKCRWSYPCLSNERSSQQKMKCHMPTECGLDYTPPICFQKLKCVDGYIPAGSCLDRTLAILPADNKMR